MIYRDFLSVAQKLEKVTVNCNCVMSQVFLGWGCNFRPSVWNGVQCDMVKFQHEPIRIIINWNTDRMITLEAPQHPPTPHVLVNDPMQTSPLRYEIKHPKNLTPLPLVMLMFKCSL